MRNGYSGMLNLALRNRYWPIGLDIGADSVKMLQLETVGGEVSVRASGRWRVPQAAQQDPSQRRQLVIAAVRDMLRNGKFRGRKVVTALSCKDLEIRNVRLPHLSDGELAEAVKWEAAERFDYEITPDRLNYLRAGDIRQGTETQEEIIMLAVDQETVDGHLELLEEMGLSPEHIGAEPVELFRVFERRLRRHADDDTVSVILDIGAEATRVVVAKGRQIVFIKSIDIAGRRLTEAAARQLNLSLQEAAELRSMIMKDHAESGAPSAAEQRAGKDSKIAQSVIWTIHDAVRGELEALAREVSLCLRYCSVTFRGLRPQSVVITGGQAYDPSVVKLLTERLGIECVIGQPLRGINVSDADLGGNRRGMLAEWALCASLAARYVAGKDDTDDDAERGQRRLSA